MAPEVSRRDFLSKLGVTVTAAAAGAASGLPALTRVDRAEARGEGRRQHPGHAVQDRPHDLLHRPRRGARRAVFKGHMLAAEEINAQGGLLGKRKIEIAQGRRERRHRRQRQGDAAAQALREDRPLLAASPRAAIRPRSGPVAEELKLLTIFVDGCTDFLFDKAVPNPHYIFRITNIQSADGVTVRAGDRPDVAQGPKQIAHIHPDYSYGRNAFDHFKHRHEEDDAAGAEVVSEGWPKLGTTDFTLAHHQGASRPSPTCSSPRCGAATTWPCTSRRCATACSRR